jgi:hypothetical protein
VLRSKTVFVLGAGASAEVGLPIGSALLEDICKLIDIRYDFNRLKAGDFLVSEALKLLLQEGGESDRYNEHLHAAWQVVESATQAISIDNIVDGLENDDIERVCKLGIVRAIHAAESSSDFFAGSKERPDQLRTSKFADTWYRSLTQLLTEGLRKSEIDRVFENFSIISFNYDRCIEAYLPRSIAGYYGVEPRQVIELFNEVPLHRPYGIAGEVNWDLLSGLPRGFGGENTEYLARSSRMIRTFTQGVDDPSSMSGMHETLQQADRIIFLGFAFHRQNMELLASSIGRPKQILATASGISESDRNVIRKDILGSFRMSEKFKDFSIELVPVHCAELFNSHWRTIAS